MFVTKREQYIIHKLIFCTIALVMLLVPPSRAQGLSPKASYTKEDYLRDCQKGSTADANAFCACHFEITMDLQRTVEIKNNQNKIDKAEKARQGILGRLKKFPAVTEANLEQVCHSTNALLWDIRTELQALHKYKTPEAKARKAELSKALVSGKIEADDIFMAYKKSHGMLTMRHGQVFDDSGKWVSTDHYMSYCVPLNKLTAIRANMNAQMHIYPYQAQSINRNPDKQKCFDLVHNSFPVKKR